MIAFILTLAICFLMGYLIVSLFDDKILGFVIAVIMEIIVGYVLLYSFHALGI